MPEAASSNEHFLRLVEKEQAWLAHQEKAVQAQLLQVYRDTFETIQGQLEAIPEDSYTRRHLQVIEAQLRVLLRESSRQQSRILGAGLQRIYEARLPAEQRVWTHLEDLFGNPAIAEQFRNIKPLINQRSVKALLMTQDTVIKNFNGDLTKKVKGAIASSMIQGHGIAKTVARLKEVEELQGHAPRLKLIARMETARANNQAKSDFIHQVNKAHPELDLWQIARDRVDKSKKTRNHWFSWALDRTVRNVSLDDYFEVHNLELGLARQNYSQITGRKASDSSVFFESFDLGRRGKTLPAHFGDRGVVLAWRPSWGLVDVKYPQAARAALIAEQKPDETSERLQSLQQKAQGATRPVKNTGELKEAAATRKEVQQQLRQLLQAPAKGSIKAAIAPEVKTRHRKQIQQGLADFEGLVGKAMDDQQIQFTSLSAFKSHPVYQELLRRNKLPDKLKAGYLRGYNLIILSNETDSASVLHELLHWYEDKTPEALALSLELHNKRLAPADIERMHQADKEHYDIEGFFEPYAGRGYLDGSKVVMTEVLTSAADKLYNKNTEGSIDLLINDKEHLEYFIKAVSLKWRS